MLVAALALPAKHGKRGKAGTPDDAVTEWFKQRKNEETHQLEPQGSVQQPGILGYLQAQRHLQADVAAKEEAAALERLPRLKAHPIGNPPFCAHHFRGERACAACSDPTKRRQAKRRKQAHLLFLNTPKSGGSALECATEGNPLGARWTNMGHTTQKAVASCMKACTFGGRPPKVVVMVRDPYDYCAPLRRPGDPKQPTQAHCP